MPNIFAYFVLFAWPFVALLLLKRRPADRVAVILLLIPYLFLPVRVVVGILPGILINKESIAAYTVFFILYLKYKGFVFLPKHGLCKYLMMGMFILPVFSWLSNTDTLIYGDKIWPGLTIGYVVYGWVDTFVTVLIPYMVGYSYLNNYQSQKSFLSILVFFGLIYSLLALWEIRVSPQLHTQIYGFFPHNFDQQYRQGGYRPVIFLGHGLLVAVFFALVLVAAIGLWKAKEGAWKKWGKYLVGYYLVILVLCKTLSGLILGGIALFSVMLFSPKRCLQIALVIGLLVWCYPFLRSVVPTEAVLEMASTYDEDRARSLQFRFGMEDILLEKGNERPLFGWGGSGRNRVYNPDTGEDMSVTDGAWIAYFGTRGWMGYFASIGLLVFPMVKMYRRVVRSKAEQIQWHVVSLFFMLSLNLLDLVPNSSISVLTFLIAGSILGSAHNLSEIGGLKKAA